MTGPLVQPDAPAAVLEALRRLLDDDELRQQLGSAARARALDVFSAPSMAAAIPASLRGRPSLLGAGGFG